MTLEEPSRCLFLSSISSRLVVVAAVIAGVAAVGCGNKTSDEATTGEAAEESLAAASESQSVESRAVESRAAAQQAALEAPADVAAPPATAERTESGLASVVLRAGSGSEHPDATSRVTVHYSGWTTDGKLFDSSRKRNAPATFPLNGVIAGWTEGLQLMVVGEQRRFWIPQNLAYQGRPGAPAGMLVFDVELLEIAPGPPPAPPAPNDVAAPPPNAAKTDSGLAHRRLAAGTGTEKPTAASRVQVHYTGWTTDGKMFDSSIVRGEPTTFPLGGVIAGWTEGLQLMVVGEKRRFWIPEDLAYKGRPGAPPGMLVFDVELLAINP